MSWRRSRPATGGKIQTDHFRTSLAGTNDPAIALVGRILIDVLFLTSGIGKLAAPAATQARAEKRYVAAQYHGVAEEGVPFRHIAGMIGRRLSVPVVIRSRKLNAFKGIPALARSWMPRWGVGTGAGLCDFYRAGERRRAQWRQWPFAALVRRRAGR
jgi:hypothetical protein